MGRVYTILRMNTITVHTTVSATIAEVWTYWNAPEHIPGWAFASKNWEAISMTNDLFPGGTFVTRMQAKDESAGFDFAGTYTLVQEPNRLEYDLDDGRHVAITFTEVADGVEIVQTFDAESENPEEVQRSGWQSFLNNFKEYVEGAHS